MPRDKFCPILCVGACLVGAASAGLAQPQSPSSAVQQQSAMADSVENAAPSVVAAAAAISGGGTIGKIPKWVGVNQLGDSIMTEKNNKLGVNTATPGAILHVAGLTPAASAGAGTDATTLLLVNNGKGGNTTGSGATAGAGAAVVMNAGAGGDAGPGGTNGDGGSIKLQPGAAGSGGSGGAPGNVLLAPTGGKVGIGTSSPTATLTIDGSIQASTSSGSSVSGSTQSGTGVTGSSAGGRGVFGTTLSAGPTIAGVWGENPAPGGTGVVGKAIGTTGTGVFGGSVGGTGVVGDTASTAALVAGVLGRVTSTSPGDSSAGVRGINAGTGALGIGVYGSHAGSGWGVYGSAPGGRGVYGSSTSGTGVFGSGGTGVVGTSTSPSGAGVAAQGSGTTGTALQISNGAIKVTGAGAGTNTPAFIHKVTASNISNGGSGTIINNPFCNGDPNAILIITRNASPGGTVTNVQGELIGVIYTSGRWHIFNVGNADMDVGLAFNVLVIKR